MKIPFLPIRDDTQQIDLPVLRNLYDHIREDLPKAGRKTAKARARAEGKQLRRRTAPPAGNPPSRPQAVLRTLQRGIRNPPPFRRGNQADQLLFEDSPPVFIVVCNNTSVSKEVYKYLAGYEIPSEDESAPPQVVPGMYELFSNYDPATSQPRRKPPTLLIDSDALENSGPD